MATERNRIFISYRRSDSAGTTTAIRKTLVERFEDQVFHDVAGIELGDRFPDALRNELDRSVIVLAVIGQGWLGAKNEFHQRRIDFPDDWVNIELSRALGSPEVTVIPVLVDGAVMPPSKALPAELAELAHRNAVQLRHEAWDESIRPLLERIEQILKPGSASGKRESEELTLDLVRHAVIEALDSRSQQAGQVLLATLDEISRVLAKDDGTTGSESRQVLNLLLGRLLARPTVQVAGYLKEIFRSTYSVTTSKGNWLGYALRLEHWSFGLRYHGCVLLLPGSDQKVAAAYVASEVEWDFYGMPTNEGRPYVSISSVRGVGYDFGEVQDSFPVELPPAFRG